MVKKTGIRKGGYNKVVIEIDPNDKYHDTVNGIKIDTSFNGHEHVKCIGVVHAIPIGLKGYENEEIVPELEVGMEVIVHNMVVDDGTSDRDENLLMRVKGMDLYHCDYNQIFCCRKTKDNPWKMIGGWVLCNEHFEERVETISYEDPLNKKMVTVPVSFTESGIISQANVKRSARIARLVNIGTSLKDRLPLNVKIGDLVVFRQNVDGELLLEGKKYVLLRQEELMIKLT